MSSKKSWQKLNSAWSPSGHSTVIAPTSPKFCIDITNMPKEAVVAKSTVAFAVTCMLRLNHANIIIHYSSHVHELLNVDISRHRNLKIQNALGNEPDPRSEVEVRGPRFEVRGPRFEVRGPRSEVRGSRSEIRGPRPEVRGPRFEVRGPRSEVRGPRSEVRGPR